jgi:hypothetical protein
MTGMSVTDKSREITDPFGCDLIQVLTNSSVSFREIDLSPIGLESIFSNIGITAAPYSSFDA